MNKPVEDLNDLLRKLNDPARTTHVTNNTAYDTAWVARLGEIDSEMSNAALDWISKNQLPDGSWGASIPVYYHDRVLSTLAVMTALARRGRRLQDRRQIEYGQAALHRIVSGATQGLMADPGGATVGFEMIMPTLLKEAEELRIVDDQKDRILGRIAKERAAKMAMLKGKMINRYISAAFSAEMAGKEWSQMLDVDNLKEPNGSIAHSPSATAYYALHVRPGDEAAIKYLRNSVRDGGVPSTTPFDVFERSWIMWNISLIKDMDSESLSLCQPHIDFLKKAWKPGKGISYAAEHILPDGDDTALTYELLSVFGHQMDIEAVLSYEEPDHFRCYTLETTPSASANVHILGALRKAGYDVNHPTIQKILIFLKRSRARKSLWIDKWHISPYYTSSHALIACAGYEDDFVQSELKWILSTQNEDGSWGFYMPTAEETAFCLQALCVWRQHGGDVPHEAIKRGAAWLFKHKDPPYPSLWIGKCLYCPEYVVRSSIISALFMADH